MKPFEEELADRGEEMWKLDGGGGNTTSFRCEKALQEYGKDIRSSKRSGQLTEQLNGRSGSMGKESQDYAGAKA